MEKQLIAPFAGIPGSIKVYEGLPILQIRYEDFALPDAPEHLINCDGVMVYQYMQFGIPITSTRDIHEVAFVLMATSEEI